MLEIIDQDHLLGLAITQAMIMIDGHIVILGMTVPGVEDVILLDCMIVILLVPQEETEVGVLVPELESQFEMIRTLQNVVEKVLHIRAENHLTLVLDLQVITREVNHLHKVMMKTN